MSENTEKWTINITVSTIIFAIYTYFILWPIELFPLIVCYVFYCLGFLGGMFILDKVIKS